MCAISDTNVLTASIGLLEAALARSRYQRGTLTRAPRKSGDVWEYRFRENGAGRTIVVGTTSQFRSETAAWRAVELVRLNINKRTSPGAGPAMTFQVLADHYGQHEMPMNNHERKAFSTKDTNYGYLRKWILPQWGPFRIAEITPIAVEEWLRRIDTLAEGSKAKIRNLMSAIYRHAQRYGFMDSNPIQLVRQGSKRRNAPVVLEVAEIHALLSALRLRERTMVLLDAGSGIRRGELFGIKWEDVDFTRQQVLIRRSIVNQIAGKVKTETSAKPMPLDDYMTADLLAWYAMTPYKDPDHYVFATDSNRAGEKRGKQPCWPNKVMDYWIKPAARSVGITKPLGWHTFRHTFATLLKANGEDVKTVQELLRHASSRVTLDLYAQALTPAKRDAQSRVVKAFFTQGTA